MLNENTLQAVDRIAGQTNLDESARTRSARDRVSAALTNLMLDAPLTEAAVLEKDGLVYVDTRFLNSLRGLLPGFTLRHLGFGNFEYRGPGGSIEFSRTSAVQIPGQSGRAHLVAAFRPSLIDDLLAAARKKGIVTDWNVTDWNAAVESTVDEVVMAQKAQMPSEEGNRVPGGMTGGSVDLNRKDLKGKGQTKGEPGARRKTDIASKPPGKAPSARGGMSGRKAIVPNRRSETGGRGRTRPNGHRPAAPASARKPGAGRSGVRDKREMPGMGGGR